MFLETFSSFAVSVMASIGLTKWERFHNDAEKEIKDAFDLAFKDSNRHESFRKKYENRFYNQISKVVNQPEIPITELGLDVEVLELMTHFIKRVSQSSTATNYLLLIANKEQYLAIVKKHEQINQDSLRNYRGIQRIEEKVDDLIAAFPEVETEDSEVQVVRETTTGKLRKRGLNYEIESPSGSITKLSLEDHFKRSNLSVTNIIYQDYLDSNRLDYISRKDFRTRRKLTYDFIDEDFIIEKVSNSLGVVLAGLGGIGKTRLLMEIGKSFMDKSWVVLIMDRRLEWNQAELLLANIDQTERYLLLFDYVEESEIFEQTVSYIFNQSLTERVKVFANCRRSYLGSIKKELSRVVDLFAFINFVEDKYLEGERAFAKHVSQVITRPIFQKLTIRDSEFYRMRPSFAVFLRYIVDTQKFTTKIHGVGSFERWLYARFEASLSRNKEPDFNKAIMLISLLPLYGDAAEEFVLKNDELEPLLIDGWLQEVENAEGIKRLDAVHDTVKDELLLSYLRKGGDDSSGLQRRILRHLNFAIEQDGLKNWYRSYQRIEDEAPISNHERFFFEFFHKVIRLGGLTESVLGSILKTSLITESEKLEIINSNKTVFLSEGFGKNLQFSLNYFSKVGAEQAPVLLYDLILAWLEANPGFIKNLALADKILSTYLKVYALDANIKPFLEAFIDMADPNYGSYTLGAWLNKGLGIERVHTYLRQFLEKNAENPDTAYVINAWVDAGGDQTEIAQYLKAYLIANAEQEDSIYCYTTWLNNNGDFEVIKPFVIKLFSSYSGELVTFLCKSLFSKEVVRNELKESLRPYLKRISKDPESKRVYQLWLESGGQPSAVEVYLSDYLKSPKNTQDFPWLISTWLYYGPDESLVSSYVHSFLGAHPLSPGASNIMQAWLFRGYSLMRIRNSIIKYVAHSAEQESTRYLMSQWLKRETDLETFELYLFRYLSKNRDSEHIRILIGAWLSRGGSLSSVSDYVFGFLDRWSDKMFASYIICQLIEEGVDLNELQEYVLRFVKANYKNTLSGFVFGGWFKANGDVKSIELQFIDFLRVNFNKKEVAFPLSMALKAGIDQESIEEYMKLYLNEHATTIESILIYRAWLDRKLSFRTVRPSMLEFLNTTTDKRGFRIVLNNWLKFDGQLKSIIDPVRDYFRNNEITQDASFVLCNWMDFGGASTEVSAYVSEYVDKFWDEDEARFVFDSWLSNQNDSTLIEDAFSRHLLKHKDSEKLGFMLNSWLSHAKEPLKFEDFVKHFLKVHWQALSSQYVLKSWIDQSASTSEILPYLLKYLSIQENALNAGFVYESWLKKSPDLKEIRPLTLEYLKFNHQNNESTYVFKAWLDAGQGFLPIKDFLIQHLARGSSLSNQFLFESWLRNNGSTSAVRDFITDFIDRYIQYDECSFTLCPWIEKEEKSIVEPYIKRYLSRHACEKNAGYVLFTWVTRHRVKGYEFVEEAIRTFLDNKLILPEDITNRFLELLFGLKWNVNLLKVYAKRLLENSNVLANGHTIVAVLTEFKEDTQFDDFVLSYLEEFCDDYKSGFVICKWLENKKPSKLLEDHVSRFLSKNAHFRGVSYVLQGWLSADGRLDLIEDHFKTYLKFNAHLPPSKYPMMDWLNNGGDLLTITPGVKKFISKNSTEFTTYKLYKCWLEFGGEVALVENAAKQYISIHEGKAEASKLQAMIDRLK